MYVRGSTYRLNRQVQQIDRSIDRVIDSYQNIISRCTCKRHARQQGVGRKIHVHKKRLREAHIGVRLLQNDDCIALQQIDRYCDLQRTHLVLRPSCSQNDFRQTRPPGQAQGYSPHSGTYFAYLWTLLFSVELYLLIMPYVVARNASSKIFFSPYFLHTIY